MFQLPVKLKTTWMHPRSRHWHLLDYMIVRRRDIQDVLITRVMRGAEVWTDHRLVRSTLRLILRPPARRQPPPPRLNVASLEGTEARSRLAASIDDCLREIQVPHLNDDIEPEVNELWNTIASTLHTTCLEALGTTQKKNPDWFNENAEEILPLLEKKNSALTAHLASPSSLLLHRKWKEARSVTQRRLREIQNEWWINKAREIQRHADENRTYDFYNAIKGIYGPTRRTITPLLSADGSSLLKDKQQILARWAEHFRLLLNQLNPTDLSALDELPTLPPVPDLDVIPSRQEVEAAVKTLKNKKAPGEDALPSEIFKYGGPTLLGKLTDLFSLCWSHEQIPDAWKHATIVTIYKKKGDRADCGNSRGISLLAVAGKILARIMLKRLLLHIAERILPESQAGFRQERSTIDMIFVARQLLEKAREQQKEMSLAFIDLRKAFDTVNREMLWRTLAKFGCPSKFVAMLRLFHDGMTAKVSVGSETSDSFDVSVGVKQGCVLAPVLFNIYLVAVTLLSQNVPNNNDGVRIRYRLDGSVFNLRRLSSTTKTLHTTVSDLQYADDAAVAAPHSVGLQRMVDSLHTAYSRMGQQINVSKTMTLQTAFHHDNPPSDILINDSSLQSTHSYTYLGSIISDDATVNEEITHRIRQASSAFGRLRDRVFANRNLRISTKVAVYHAVCVSTLLYGCETWTVYSRQMRLLESFHTQCLKRILNISWQERIPHTEILHRSSITSIESMFIQRTLRWAGHVARMDESRLPRILLYSELASGTRPVGRPKKRWKDQLKHSLRSCNIEPLQFEALANNRPLWRSTVREGVQHFEAERTRKREEKRARRHRPPEPNAPRFLCHFCPRICGSRIGLHSHERTHRRETPPNRGRRDRHRRLDGQP